MTWKKASANKLTKCYVKILTYLCILMYPTKVKRFTLLGAQLAFETIASHFDVPHAMIEWYTVLYCEKLNWTKNWSYLPCSRHVLSTNSLLTNQTRYSLHVCHFQFYHMIHTSLALLLGWIYVEKCSIHYKLILRGTYASSIDMLSCYTLTHCLLIVQSPLNLELFLWTSTFLS